MLLINAVFDFNSNFYTYWYSNSNSEFYSDSNFNSNSESDPNFNSKSESHSIYDLILILIIMFYLQYKEAVPLMGRSAILGEQRNNYFCDVACGKAESGDSTYAITRSGLLCEFNNRRLLDKWVELRVRVKNHLLVHST